MKRHIDIRSDLITPRVAMSLLPVFTASYNMATFASDTIDFCGGELRDQILPHLKNWAVEYELHRRSTEGIIPFTSSMVYNSKKNHKHLELRRNGFVLTVSQTHTIKSMPRDCVFRNDHCTDGQLALKGFGLLDEEAEEKEIYAILTHGWASESPSFVLCGIPNPGLTAWDQHVDLISMIRDIHIIDTSPVTEDIKLDFRDSIKERSKEIQ